MKKLTAILIYLFIVVITYSQSSDDYQKKIDSLKIVRDSISIQLNFIKEEINDLETVKVELWAKEQGGKEFYFVRDGHLYPKKGGKKGFALKGTKVIFIKKINEHRCEIVYKGKVYEAYFLFLAPVTELETPAEKKEIVKSKPKKKVVNSKPFVSTSHTFSNNYSTNYMYGKTGDLKKSSVSWIITNVGNGIYQVTYTPCFNNQCSINVKYSHYDSSNKLYVYVPSGENKFDGAFLKQVMSSGKLSAFSNGIVLSGENVMGIIFTDDTGYIMALSE